MMDCQDEVLPDISTFLENRMMENNSDSRVYCEKQADDSFMSFTTDT
jgi:hypothetical protein